jgi:hypothetical protein
MMPRVNGDLCRRTEVGRLADIIGRDFLLAGTHGDSREWDDRFTASATASRPDTRSARHSACGPVPGGSALAP